MKVSVLSVQKIDKILKCSEYICSVSHY